MIKKIILLVIFISIATGSSAHNVQKNYESVYDNRIKFYSIYYNILQLSPEQISKFEYIFEIYSQKYKFEINNSKLIKKLAKKEYKELMLILDKRQKQQFRILKHLERQDIKRNFKETDYYKSNPRMSIFGDIHKK